MRTFLLLALLATLISHATCQTITTKQTIQTLVLQRSIYLNGGARASLGGKSRTAIQINLPTNTKSWYYSFSTSPGESGVANLNLALQLTAMATYGLSTVAASKINVPPGSASIDACLMDQANADLFIRKVDIDGGQYRIFREGLIENTKQGVIEIKEINQGTVYIGLKNPSTLEGVNIIIEVAAVVEYVEEFTETQTQAMALGNLGWKAFERGEYDKCIELSAKALALDNTLGYVHFNIALSYLIKGLNTEAVEMYTKAISITKQSSFANQTFEGAIQDLNNYMSKIPYPDDAKDILDILRIEIKK